MIDDHKVRIAGLKRKGNSDRLKPAKRISRSANIKRNIRRQKAREHASLPRITMVDGYAEGQHDGYAQGNRYGYHLGACEAIKRQIPTNTGVLQDIKVFYVKEGFVSLDDGIADALRGLVREVVTLHEAEDAARLAAILSPDLVIVLNGTRFPLVQVDALREQGIRTVIWLVDDPYHTDISSISAPHYDVVFTHERNGVPFYRELGCPQVHYLPLAAATKLYSPRKVDMSYHTDICFIANAFWNRVTFIDQVAPFLAGKKTLIAGWWWDRLANYKLLKDKIKPNTDWMPPEETASFYNGAKIVINLHRSNDDPANFNSRGIAGHSINPRTYEISGSGAFQLTDARVDLPALYKPGMEIATYESPQDFMEKAAYYLEHEEEREAIALRGLRRTLEDHTYRKRLIGMLQTLYA